ncbi:MAG: TIGR04283 family arsenosugar biosynthesis glycosyltransferase [Gammaproteobacteria bacterium]
MSRLSIIIPTLNEAALIAGVLRAVHALRRDDDEVIVVDGGSGDGTAALVAAYADVLLLQAERGRAAQMNAGARLARGEVLWFLHADTLPPPGAADALIAALADSGREWGHFDVQLSDARGLLRAVAPLMNLRARITGIATGDQGLFMRRALFAAVGGFPAIELMEDVALSRLLKRRGPPGCVAATLLTSSRRWETRGVLRTILLMWSLRLAYALGVAPGRLARWYR